MSDTERSLLALQAKYDQQLAGCVEVVGILCDGALDVLAAGLGGGPEGIRALPDEYLKIVALLAGTALIGAELERQRREEGD